MTTCLDVSTGPLLAAKLAQPALPLALVARPRLNDRFVLDKRVRLLIVQAPPGYGKTTLVADRLTALEQNAVWLCLDARDNEPLRFMRYFEAALRRLCKEHLGIDLPVLGNDITFAGAIEHWLTSLPEQAPPCRLVIDEFEHLTDAFILESLVHWLRHQPRWLTLTLLSRTRPALGLSTMRLRGELEEIGLGDLAFDLEEARTLCAEQLVFPPTRVSLERALRRTEGWAMSLCWLVERTTTRAGFDALVERLSGAHPDFVAWFDDLLEEAVSDTERQLLLQLGVLSRFSPELSARLLDDSETSQRLVVLENAGLFIQRIDPHDQWCRFHTLFDSYLRHRRHELDLTQQRMLHSRASQAWLALGELPLAVDQAISAGDDLTLESLLIDQGATLLAMGQFSLLAHALATLGEPRLANRPKLVLLYGWVAHSQYQFERVSRCLSWAENQVEKEEWKTLDAELITLQAQLAINQGDAKRAAPLAERALSLPARYLAATPISAASILGESRFVLGHLDEASLRMREVEHEAIRIDDPQLMLWALCQQSEVLVAQGRLQVAFDTQERAFALIDQRSLGELPITEFLFRIRSQLLWEWHHLDEAEQAALGGIAVLDSQGERWTLQCHISLAKVAQARGDQAQCADHIRRIRKILPTGDYHIDWLANTHATLLTWWQSTSDRDAVARWLDDAPLTRPATATNHFMQCNARNRARALIMLERFDEARALLLALEEQTAKLGLITDANRNQLWLAVLEWQCGQHEVALNHMSRALELANRTALIGSFLRLGKPLVDMLKTLLAERDLDNLSRSRAERLIDLASRQRDFGRAVRLILDDTVIADIVSRPDVPELIRISPLTRREWQILGLIHAGLSNEQIAEQLGVAPTTIKTHIRSLYQKQNIRRREEAIALARNLLSHIQGE